MKRLGLFLIGIVLLTGCNENASSQATPPSARNVAWYLAHEKEHEITKQRCKADPGALRQTADCVNADQAQKEIFVWGREDALRQAQGGS
jgi:hypothetical protein